LRDRRGNAAARCQQEGRSYDYELRHTQVHRRRHRSIRRRSGCNG
jgi:hypothetical protein